MANLYRGSTELAFHRSFQGDPDRRDRSRPAAGAGIVLCTAQPRQNIFGTKAKPEGEVADCTALIDSYRGDKTLKAALTEVYQPDGAANLVATIYRQRANAYIRLGKARARARDDPDLWPCF